MKYSALKGRSIGRAGLSAAAMLLLFSTALTAHADARTQAKRIHDRLTGVPPKDTVAEPVLTEMANAIANDSTNGAQRAAYIAMQNSKFYNTTLKNWVTPWTNEDSNPYTDLNDFTATVIGLIRDDTTTGPGESTNIPFTQVLTEDVVYLGAATEDTYSLTNNNHYVTLQNNIVRNQVNLSKATDLIRRTQSEKSNGTLTSDQTAGIMTTQAFAAAFIRDGTNRRAIRFTFKNFLCRDIEDVSDVSRTPDRVRQDVTRSPGGDSAIYLSQCVGCHAGMDPLAQAFAYYDYKEIVPKAGNQLVVTPGKVQPKNHINAGNFPLGYVVTNDKWDNYWRNGKNASLGWASISTEYPGSGHGIKSLGKELAGSRAFAACQVQKAFKLTCLKDPSNQTDIDKINTITDIFVQSNYSMKRVFAETAAYCKGD